MDESQPPPDEPAPAQNADAWRLNPRQRWLFSLPAFLWLVVILVYPLLIDRLLGPVLETTGWRALPPSAKKILALSAFVRVHYWQFGTAGLLLVWLYFRWASRDRVRAQIYDLILLSLLASVLYQAYRGLSAAGVL